MQKTNEERYAKEEINLLPVPFVRIFRDEFEEMYPIVKGKRKKRKKGFYREELRTIQPRACE